MHDDLTAHLEQWAERDQLQRRIDADVLALQHALITAWTTTPPTIEQQAAALTAVVMLAEANHPRLPSPAIRAAAERLSIQVAYSVGWFNHETRQQ
jgi:hypothetical protein